MVMTESEQWRLIAANERTLRESAEAQLKDAKRAAQEARGKALAECEKLLETMSGDAQRRAQGWEMRGHEAMAERKHQEAQGLIEAAREIRALANTKEGSDE